MSIVSIAPRLTIMKAGNVNLSYLRNSRFYKVLSLYEASKAGACIPHTLFIIDFEPTLLSETLNSWQWPLILRMDYSKMPNHKFLGGITVSSEAVLKRLCNFLLVHGYLPLVHPFLDRFKNIYSAGVLLIPGSTVAHVEVVGTGFDASDLRLGAFNPHESYNSDVLTRTITDRTYITDNSYLTDRNRRISRIRALKKYTGYANKSGRLSHKLHRFSKSGEHNPTEDVLVPMSYQVMTSLYRRELHELCYLIQTEVIGNLPKSQAYVASMSFLEGEGWLLWDVYGEWYRR